MNYYLRVSQICYIKTPLFTQNSAVLHIMCMRLLLINVSPTLNVIWVDGVMMTKP